MCFRPSVLEDSVECPECGKKTNAVMGRLPHACPFCDADISELAKAHSAPNDSSLLGSSLKSPTAPQAPPPASTPVPPKSPEPPSSK